MGSETEIGWTDSTFNVWWGCTKVSDACTNCYAETFDKRVGGSHWGAGVPRRVFGEKHWREPLKWNAAAEKLGKRRRVFCSSMADVFDSEAPEGEREKLWPLIRQTPWLDWQLLTKRPHNIRKMLPADWGDGYQNVWLGTTVEDQKTADLRVPVLLAAPARIRFLSCEPLLGPVDLRRYVGRFCGCPQGGSPSPCDGWQSDGGCANAPARIGWVIVGGESGPGARPFDLAWARSIVEQCRSAGVACFVKQLGTVPVMDEAAWRAEPAQRLLSYANGLRAPEGSVPLKFTDRKGGDWCEWPRDLLVREFPEASR